MSHPEHQFSFTPDASGDTFPAVLDIDALQDAISRDNNFKDMDWQRPARGWPGSATDLTYPLFTKDLPPIELNWLYYPSSGVCSWGFVYLAFTGEDIEKIKASPTGTIELAQSSTEKVVFENWTLVATVPLWEVGKNYGGRITSIGDDAETLHLALFADDRYWKANYSRGLAWEEVPTTWSSLILQLTLAVGIEANAASLPDIPGDYGFPSPRSDWMEMFQYNSAVMLDAALLNVGLLIVRKPDGNYAFITTREADTIERNVDLSASFLRAGGNWARNKRSDAILYLGLPENCVIQYPLWDDRPHNSSDPPYPPTGPQWLWQWDNDEGQYHVRSALNTTYYHPVSVNIADAFTYLGMDCPTTPNMGTKLFRSTARACTESGDNAHNLGNLMSLSIEVVAEWYLRKLWTLTQETWNGILQPSGSGWFIYIYYYGATDCYTKVRGNALNAEYEQLMHDVDCEESSSESENESESESESESEGPSSEGPSEGSSEGPSSEGPSEEPSSGCNQPWVPPCPSGDCPEWTPVNDCNGNPTGMYQLTCGTPVSGV